MQEEIWKDVPGYEGCYQVSSLGRVKSLARRIYKRKYSFICKEVILKASCNKYCLVSLSKESKSVSMLVHQLVAMAFLNHKPDRFNIVIDHINNIKTDNRVENLQIVTQRENVAKELKDNSSKYVGVCYRKRDSVWNARIFFNKKLIHLGSFKTEEEASEYYINALKAINNDEEIIIKKPKFSSRHKGVCWNKQKNKWLASIYVNGKSKYIGYFNTEIEAHEACQNKKNEILNNKSNK